MTSAFLGPPDGRVVPRYAGPDTFARLPRLDAVNFADVAVVGVPFDSGVSYRPGARFGPAAIRAASKMLRPYHPALDVEPWNVMQVADAGDLVANPFSIAEAIASIDTGARGLLEKVTHLVAIGGDHTIALPLIRAVAAKFGPIGLVHFDAHLDTWDTYFGEPYTHGTPFRRAVEEGLLDLDSSAHIGIRSPLYARSDLAEDADLGFAIVSATEVATNGIGPVMNRVKARLGARPTYVSIDIDVLDPSHAPGTGTPEPGGLTSRELQMMLRAMEGMNLVGADVVEVAPAYDHAEITALAAASMVYEVMALLARSLQGSADRRAYPEGMSRDTAEGPWGASADDRPETQRSFE